MYAEEAWASLEVRHNWVNSVQGEQWDSPLQPFFLCKAKEILNDTIKQLNLIGIFRTLHKKKKKHPEHTFFSSTHDMVSRTDYILGHKIRLNVFKSIEIISSIFSDILA